MSSLTSGFNASHSSASSSVLFFNATVHQQSSHFPNRQAVDEKHSLIDYSKPENRLYERPDGSIVLAEKSIGCVIGEQVLAPTIDMIGSCVKGVFRFVGDGLGYLSSGLSKAYNFQILPTVSAERSPSTTDLSSCNIQLEDIPKALEECNDLLSREGTKDLYYRQGVLYQKLGQYHDAAKSFQLALEKDPNFSSAKQGLQEVEGFTRNSQDPSYREAFLGEIGFDLPSHYEYLAMSSLVYEDLESDNLATLNLTSFEYKEESHKSHAKQLASKGWELAGIKHEEKSSYVGMAFINQKYKSIVVAHRGIEISSPQGLANCLSIFQGERPKQYRDAEQFTESLAKSYPEYTFSHAGHSLGAVYAELLAYYRGESAITAESPGILNMVSQHFMQGGDLSAPIVSYLSTPNVLNTCNTHLGTVRAVHITPSIISRGIIGSTIDWFSSWWGTGENSWARLGLDAAKMSEIVVSDKTSHQIKVVLERFSPKNGYAPYSFVKRWPKGVQERMQFKIACGDECDPSKPSSFSSSQKHAIAEVYQTELVSTKHLKLSEFSKKARDFLLNLRSLEKIPAN